MVTAIDASSMADNEETNREIKQEVDLLSRLEWDCERVYDSAVWSMSTRSNTLWPAIYHIVNAIDQR